MYKIINQNLQEHHDCKTKKKNICEKNILSCGEKYGYRKQKELREKGGKFVVTLKSHSPAPLLYSAPFPNLLDLIWGYIRLALEVPMRLLPD